MEVSKVPQVRARSLGANLGHRSGRTNASVPTWFVKDQHCASHPGASPAKIKLHLFEYLKESW